MTEMDLTSALQSVQWPAEGCNMKSSCNIINFMVLPECRCSFCNVLGRGYHDVSITTDVHCSCTKGVETEDVEDFKQTICCVTLAELTGSLQLRSS